MPDTDECAPARVRPGGPLKVRHQVFDGLYIRWVTGTFLLPDTTISDEILLEPAREATAF